MYIIAQCLTSVKNVDVSLCRKLCQTLAVANDLRAACGAILISLFPAMDSIEDPQSCFDMSSVSDEECTTEACTNTNRIHAITPTLHKLKTRGFHKLPGR